MEIVYSLRGQCLSSSRKKLKRNKMLVVIKVNIFFDLQNDLQNGVPPEYLKLLKNTLLM